MIPNARLLPLICLMPLAAAIAQTPEGDSAAPAVQCIPPGDIPPRQPYGARTGLPLSVNAHNFEGNLQVDQPLHIEGDVHIVHGDMELETDRIDWDPASGRADIPGPLTYRDSVIKLDAERAWYDVPTERGRFEQVRYHIAGAEASGHAEVIETIEPGRYTRLTAFDFTTCAPEDPDWQIKAGSVRVNHERGTATARNARLIFKGVPVLYSPWLSFPVDNRRKTGFLYPRMAVSNDDGLDLAVPWYWNIAPNHDFTLTPRWIYNRGPMLGGEYRMLQPSSRGQVSVEYLPDDDRTGSDRYHGRLNYRILFASNWAGRLNLAGASDDAYFSDLGGDLEQASVPFLRSSGQIRGWGRNWNVRVLADGFQVLDETVPENREPYWRLPRVAFKGDWPVVGNFEFSMDSEVVNFHRDHGTTGVRADFLPRLAWNWQTPGAFFRPALGWRSSAWYLDDDDGQGNRNEYRNLPIASADGGLIFERAMRSGGIQTLEPRLFYLYVPREDQDDLPIFDTRELTFGFSQLFHDNRFSGADRQSDANQLTAAVTTRLLDPMTGVSRLELSLGQIFFFRDQDVQLPGVEARNNNFSAWVGEAIWRPKGNVSFNAAVQWDPEDNELDVAAAGLSYRGRDSRQVALGYRFRRDRLDQIDFRFRWPLARNLNAIGRVNYSFMDSDYPEILAGLEWESCCWALQLSYREWIKDREAKSRNAFFLEFHLKGLGSLGRRPYRLFEDTL